MSSRQAAIKAVARQAVRMMTVRRVHRVRILSGTITQGANTSFVLLTCDDDPDYDLATDGTNVAECQPGARIEAVQIVMSIFGSNIAGETIEWVIGRDQDNALGAASFSVSELYAADFTGNRAILRKNVWGVGHFIGTANRDVSNTGLNITKALRRARLMADGDTIRLNFTATAAGGDHTVYLRGRIITRGP